jgi:hypothetical protein
MKFEEIPIRIRHLFSLLNIKKFIPCGIKRNLSLLRNLSNTVAFYVFNLNKLYSYVITYPICVSTLLAPVILAFIFAWEYNSVGGTR